MKKELKMRADKEKKNALALRMRRQLPAECEAKNINCHSQFLAVHVKCTKLLPSKCSSSTWAKIYQYSRWPRCPCLCLCVVNLELNLGPVVALPRKVAKYLA